MKRNEAIGRLRLLYSETNAENKAALECLIPELKESEDERIRVALCDIVRDVPYMETELRAHGLTVEKTIAYLEKQKENPKSADSIPADCVSNAKCEDRSLKHSDSFGTDIRDTPAYWRGWDDAMKQKEQKPAWSAEDERRIDAICELLENTSAIHPNYSHRKLIIWLKSLRPQQKQEWSEEDEEMIERICANLEYLAKEAGCDSKLKEKLEERIKWMKRLKSLCPSWKPSEEQMRALQRAVNKLAKTDTADSVLLSIMYDNLKKRI